MPAYYARKMGAPSVPPGRYFRMHMVGYFEGIASERGIDDAFEVARVNATFKAAGAALMYRHLPAGMADPYLLAGEDDAHPFADQPPRHRIGVIA